MAIKLWVCNQKTAEILEGIEAEPKPAYKCAVTSAKVYAREAGRSDGRRYFIDKTDDSICYEIGGFIVTSFKP